MPLKLPVRKPYKVRKPHKDKVEETVADGACMGSNHISAIQSREDDVDVGIQMSFRSNSHQREEDFADLPPSRVNGTPTGKSRKHCAKCGHKIKNNNHNCSYSSGKASSDSSQEQNDVFTACCVSCKAYCPKKRSKQPKETTSSNGCDVFWSLFGMIGYLYDIGSDIFLALGYYNTNHYKWFALTLVFIIVPAIIMNIFNFVLMVIDRSDKKNENNDIQCCTPSCFLKFLLTVLLLGPVARYIFVCFYACQGCSAKRKWNSLGQELGRYKRQYKKRLLSKQEYSEIELEILPKMQKANEKSKKFYGKMVNEDLDAMILKLFEAFMEAAPQVVLQLYLLTLNGLEDGWYLVAQQLMSLSSSLVTVSMSIVSFHTSLRLSLKDKAELSILAKGGIFMWRLFTISSRIVAFAMFSIGFGSYIFAVIGVHWIIMFIWIVQQNTHYFTPKRRKGIVRNFCNRELAFQFMASFVHIFCFFNIVGGHTRLRAIFYYSCVYVENCGMVVAWYVGHATTIHSWPKDFQTPVLLIVLIGFWMGIFFMVIYYLLFHPNNYSTQHESIKCCVPCKELSLCYDPEYPEYHKEKLPEQTILMND